LRHGNPGPRRTYKSAPLELYKREQSGKTNPAAISATLLSLKLEVSMPS